MAEPVRIQKIIADSGRCSRRAAEALIAAGRVTVNGRPCSLGDKAMPDRDRIAIDGAPIASVRRRTLYYVMLNKPRGFVTTMHDEQDRKDVSLLVKDVPARVYPVGRLDRNSEGLLLMTNDGELANRMMHPGFHVSKLYRVTVRGKITDEQLAQLAGGIVLDGRPTEEAQLEVLSAGEERSVLEIVIHEGRNRQVRRMCEAVGLEVIRLKRNAEGSLRLGMLQPGKWRYLTDEEVELLKQSTMSAGADTDGRK